MVITDSPSLSPDNWPGSGPEGARKGPGKVLPTSNHILARFGSFPGTTTCPARKSYYQALPPALKIYSGHLQCCK